MFYFYLYYVPFFAATLQNNFKQFALKEKCSTPPSPFLLLASITVLRCEVFCIWQTLCHSVHCKNLHSRWCFLNSSNRRAFTTSPFPCYHSIQSSVLCCNCINMFLSLSLVETQNVYHDWQWLADACHHLSENGQIWSVSHHDTLNSYCLCPNGLCSFKLLEGALMSFFSCSFCKLYSGWCLLLSL